MTYREYLKHNKDLIAMVHLPALPGTPRNTLTPERIIETALSEALFYQHAGFQTVMIENMHDVPYARSAGAEITALMGIIGKKIKEQGLFCGIQILAGCNIEALGTALAAGLDFIRVEGFVFGHIADEGFFDACAGDLLRRRSALNANHILVFTDIKKKHASHAITADIDLQYTADAARFFLTDGIVITGTVTGRPVDVESLKNLEAPSVLKIVGSGVTPENINMVFPFADAFIVGSTLKKNGVWHNPPHKQRVDRMMKVFKRLAGADSRRE